MRSYWSEIDPVAVRRFGILWQKFWMELLRSYVVGRSGKGRRRHDLGSDVISTLLWNFSKSSGWTCEL